MDRGAPYAKPQKVVDQAQGVPCIQAPHGYERRLLYDPREGAADSHHRRERWRWQPPTERPRGGAAQWTWEKRTSGYQGIYLPKDCPGYHSLCLRLHARRPWRDSPRGMRERRKGAHPRRILGLTAGGCGRRTPMEPR